MLLLVKKIRKTLRRQSLYANWALSYIDNFLELDDIRSNVVVTKAADFGGKETFL